MDQRAKRGLLRYHVSRNSRQSSPVAGKGERGKWEASSEWESSGRPERHQDDRSGSDIRKKKRRGV